MGHAILHCLRLLIRFRAGEMRFRSAGMLLAWLSCTFVIYHSGRAESGALTRQLELRQPREHIACGLSTWKEEDAVKTPVYKICRDKLQLLNFPTPPYIREDGSLDGWDADLIAESTIEERLVYLIMAQFQSYGTLHRAIRNETRRLKYGSKKVDGSDCGRYVSYSVDAPDLSMVTKTAPDYAEPSNFDRDYKRFAKIRKECQSWANEELANTFSGLQAVAQIRYVLDILDGDFKEPDVAKKIGKIFIALQTQRADLYLERLYNFLLSADDYWMDPYRGHHYDASSIVNLKDASYELIDLFNDQRFVKESTDTAVAIGANLRSLPGIGTALRDGSGEDASRRRLKNIIYISDRIYLSGFVDISGIQADTVALTSGKNLIVAANEVVVGRDSEFETMVDLIPLAEFQVNNTRAPLHFPSSDPAELGSAGRFFLISPNVTLTTYELKRLRRAVEFFSNAFAPAGLEKFRLSSRDLELFMLWLGGDKGFVDQNNPITAIIKNKGEMSLAEFIPMWEQALKWQIENDPQPILSRFVMVEDGDVVVAYNKHPNLPLGNSTGTVYVARSFSSLAIPVNALDEWKFRYLQYLDEALIKARAKGDRLGILNVFGRLVEFIDLKMPTSGVNSEKINQKIGALLDKKAQFTNVVAIREEPVRIPGEVERTILSFSDTDTLRKKIAPTFILPKPQRIDGKEYVGVLQIASGGTGDKIKLNMEAELHTDERTWRHLTFQKGEPGQVFSRSFPSWELTARPLIWPGLEKIAISQTGVSSLQIGFLFEASQATPFISALSSLGGVPLVFDWLIKRDPAANSDIYGPISLRLSILRTFSPGVLLSDGHLQNKSNNSIVVEYVCPPEQVCQALDEEVKLAPGASASTTIIPGTAFDPAGVRISDQEFDWLKHFFIENGQIVRTFSVRNQISAVEEFGGRHRYVDFFWQCVSGGIATRASEQPVRLIPGAERSITCLKGSLSDVQLKLSGTAYFENGGAQQIDLPMISSPVVDLDRSILK